MLTVCFHLLDCARSIGCVEVGSRSELEEKFRVLKSLESTQYYQEVIQGDTEPNPYGMSSGIAYSGGKWVAMPSPHVMDVGMTQAEWPLSSSQFADATVKLEFPVTAEGRRLGTRDALETLLSEDFADSKSFGTSDNNKAMKKAIEKYVRDNIGNLSSGGKVKSESQEFADGDKKESEIFAFAGVDLFDAKVERKKKNRRDNIGFGRYLRASRWTQEEEEEVLEVTYTFTARGTYNVSTCALFSRKCSFDYDLTPCIRNCSLLRKSNLGILSRIQSMQILRSWGAHSEKIPTFHSKTLRRPVQAI